MKIVIPVKCQNGHRSVWIIEISGLDVRTIGVDHRLQCDCPKEEIGQGYFPAASRLFGVCEMSKDLMREQFEAWAIARGQSVLRQGAGYAAERTGMAWLCWQASREAVVVELPSTELFGEYSQEAASVMRDGCAEAIEAQGLKVAP